MAGGILVWNWLLILDIGAGYDQIDVQACTKHDVRVSNVPTAVDDATADTNIFLILGALRGFNTCKAVLFSYLAFPLGPGSKLICYSNVRPPKWPLERLTSPTSRPRPTRKSSRNSRNGRHRTKSHEKGGCIWNADTILQPQQAIRRTKWWSQIRQF